MNHLHHLKATLPDGRVFSRAATRNFTTCWVDEYNKDHWTLDASRVPLGMASAPAETITPQEYRAIKAAARK